MYSYIITLQQYIILKAPVFIVIYHLETIVTLALSRSLPVVFIYFLFFVLP